MRITNLGSLHGVSRPTDAAKRIRTEANTKEKEAYRPSAIAGEFNIARRAILAASDIREDKVSAIIDRINAGEYNVSAKDVASRIIDRRA